MNNKNIQWFRIGIAALLLTSCSVQTSGPVKVSLVQSIELPFNINAIAWHPEGRTVALGGTFSNKIKIVNVGTGEIVRSLDKQTGGVGSLAYNNKGNMLAVGRSIVRGIPEGYHINIYDMNAGKMIKSIVPPPAKKGQANDVRALAFTLDDKSIIANGYGSVSNGVIYDINTGDVVSAILPPTQKSGILSSVVLVRDGSNFLIGRMNGEIEFWSTRTVKLKEIILAHTDLVTAIAINPNGEQFATATTTGIIVNGKKIDDPIKIWKLKSKKLQKTLQGHTGRVTSLSYGNEGIMLLSSSDDKTARLWNISEGKQVAIIEDFRARVYSAAGPVNKLFATADGKRLRIWKILKK